jgi:hypothetical protein
MRYKLKQADIALSMLLHFELLKHSIFKYVSKIFNKAGGFGKSEDIVN